MTNQADVMVLTTVIVCALPQTFDNVWRHAWLSDLGLEGYYWQLVVATRHVSNQSAMHRTTTLSYTSKNYAVQNVNNFPYGKP